jgi:hypothetical protein
MEREHGDQGWSITGVFEEHRGYVMGSIFSTVAFVEATINELFKDATEPYMPAGPISQVPESVKSLLAEQWRQGVSRFDTLSKYQTALNLAGKQPLDPGRQPYQDARSLIKLRNKLIHYEPEWSTVEHPIERELQGKFPENPFVPTYVGNPFYPDRCLSHGCAKWSVKSSLALTEEFHTRLGTTPTYDPYRPFLDTE